MTQFYLLSRLHLNPEAPVSQELVVFWCFFYLKAAHGCMRWACTVATLTLRHSRKLTEKAKLPFVIIKITSLGQFKKKKAEIKHKKDKWDCNFQQKMQIRISVILSSLLQFPSPINKSQVPTLGKQHLFLQVHLYTVQCSPLIYAPPISPLITTKLKERPVCAFTVYIVSTFLRNK